MTEKDKAEQIFNMHYFEIQEYGEEYGEEILISILSIKASIVTVETILALMINTFKWDVNHNRNIRYWKGVKLELKKM